LPNSSKVITLKVPGRCSQRAPIRRLFLASNVWLPRYKLHSFANQGNKFTPRQITFNGALGETLQRQYDRMWARFNSDYEAAIV
jgi:hypothetical protein